METWHQEKYAALGLPPRFVQDNLSRSAKGVLRGLHYQHPQAQGKLVYVLEGEVFDVAVDIRAGSPTFGRHVSASLSADNKRQMYVPPGFAHGFCVISDSALFAYKCTDFYNAKTDGGVRWDDPTLGIDWPVTKPSLSDKDRVAPLLKEVPSERLPPYEHYLG